MYLRALPVIPKGLERERGLTIMEFRGHGGVMHFGISEGIGGLKYGSHPSVGTVRLIFGLDVEVDPPFRCITQYPSFQRGGLHREVSENAIVEFSQVCIIRAPQEMNNMYVTNNTFICPCYLGSVTDAKCSY